MNVKELRNCNSCKFHLAKKTLSSGVTKYCFYRKNI